MIKKFFRLTFFFTLVGWVIGCANKGNPEGGPMDEAAPIIVRSSPENYSTNFKGNEIRIFFDEYIKIKDLQKQLIISPPMDPPPIITPLGNASKYIKIIINDTLDANTTYAFNFGQSIVDNNEGNPYSFFKYVFSTGDYIDSLSVKGQIYTAGTREIDDFVSVMLYEYDSTYTDSSVYKKRPRYITNTLDSSTTFNLENLKPGKYKMFALKDNNSNYTYEQKADKIGFYDGIVTVPTDSTFSLNLFKEVLDPEILNPRQAAGQKIAFGFEGGYKDVDIAILEETPTEYKSRLTKDKAKDTLYYWYKPKMEIDTAYFAVRNSVFNDTLLHRFRELDRDSLIISSINSGSIDFEKDLIIEANIPFISIDETRINIHDKDTVNVAFETEYDSILNRYSIKFEKKESDVYKVEMLPATFTDFFENTNDTLSYSIRTKAFSDYSNYRAIITNANYPIVVQLVNKDDVVMYEKVSTESTPIDFQHVAIGTYYLRIVEDTNANGKWDSGNFLENIKPEKIIYYQDEINTRANFDFVTTFDLPQTNPDQLKN